MALLSSAAQYTVSGNPNGSVAGQVGDQCTDVSSGNPQPVYRCSVAGSSTTAVWLLTGGYEAGSGVTITGNVISSTGGGAPLDATFILKTPNGFLPDAQALSALPSGLLYNTTGTGVLSQATVSQIATAAALNQFPSQHYVASGNITISDFDGQYLILGVEAAGASVIMPNPASSNPSPWKNGYAYIITMQTTNGVTTSYPVTLLNSDSTPILNAGSAAAVTMYPGDTWVVYYANVGEKGRAYQINNSTATFVQGRWFPVTSDSSVNVYQNYMSTEYITNSTTPYVRYTFPGYWTICGTPTTNTFVFKNTDGSDFSTAVIPVAGNWQTTGGASGSTVQINWAINPTSTGRQVLVTCLTGGTVPNFQNSALIPSVVINVPL